VGREGGTYYEVVLTEVALRANAIDARGRGVRPVLGIVDDGVDELEGKRETQKGCFDGEDVGDGGRVEGQLGRRSVERVHGLEAGGERRDEAGECHGLAQRMDLCRVWLKTQCLSDLSQRNGIGNQK
jgi:hypothetical protein